MNETFLLAVSRLHDSLASGYPDPAAISQLKSDLSVIIDTYSKAPPTLSSDAADFYTILLQLREYVKREDTWKDFYISSTGMTLLEIVAAIGAFLQNSVHVAFRETFPHTANRASSVYAATRLLGVKIARRTPAKVKVWLKRSDTAAMLTIPSFTQFSVGGVDYFNPDEIRFPSGESLLPLNVTFDEFGTAVRKDQLIKQVYLAQLIFPDEGQLYYPCQGQVIVTHGTKTYQGVIRINGDPSSLDSAFGTITFVDEVILPGSAEFKLRIAQYTGVDIQGTLKPHTASTYLRFPTTINFQIKRTGVGASILTPAVGTANIPQTSVIISNEDYAVVKNKYLLPQYLDKPIVVYDNDLFLYDGRVLTYEHTVAGDGDQAFYSFALNQPGFKVSNEHLLVEVFDGVLTTVWKPAINNALWEHQAEDLVYCETTLGTGDCSITFGDGVHGKRVELGWKIKVRYVLTTGASFNNVSQNEAISCAGYQVAGATLTSPYGGANEKTPNYYRVLGPSLFKSRSRAVTLEDHEAILLSYPNVADAVVFGQKDLAPYDIRFMNRLTVVLLPNSPNLKAYPKESLKQGLFDAAIVNPKDPNEANSYQFSPLELQDFQARFKQVAFSGLDVDFFRFPQPLPIYLKIRAFIYNQYALDTVAAALSSQLRSLFFRSQGILGRSLLIADITKVCHLPEVDYIEVLQPNYSVILSDSVADKSTFICLAEAPEILVEYTNRRNFN